MIERVFIGDYNMAQLNSPGVSVTVVDESFYTPAAPGTVPLIIVASEESKQNGAGTGIAPGTLASNAGQVYLLTSQKDLSDTFGIPKFITDASNSPVHAGELNEYGLQAAYSFLGVSNRAYVVRANLDLDQLSAAATAPSGPPTDGAFWLDTANTQYGVFEWNGASAAVTGGQSFSVTTPVVITDRTLVVNFAGGDYTPKSSYGSVGSYAIVAVTSLVKLWFKKSATVVSPASPAGWVEVGTPEWTASWPSLLGTISNVSMAAGNTLIINGTTAVSSDGTLAALISDINTKLVSAGITAAAPTGNLALYSTGVDITITGGTAITPTNSIGMSAGTYPAPDLTLSPHTQVPQYKSSVGNNPTGSVWVKTTQFNMGADWIINRYNANTTMWTPLSAPLYADNKSALLGLDPTGGGANLALNSLYVKYDDSSASPSLADFKIYRRSNVGATSITSVAITSSITPQAYAFTISESQVGTSDLTTPVTIAFTITALGGSPTPSQTAAHNADIFLTAINTALVGSNIVATLIASTNQVVISHITGGDINFQDSTNNPLTHLFNAASTVNFYNDPTGDSHAYVASLWTSLTDDRTGGFAIASATAPSNIPVDGVLWYDSTIEDVDIMIHNGTTWVGYLDATAITINHAGISGATDTDTLGPIISFTTPTMQRDGTPLANGDIWISTADIENYPLVYVYNLTIMNWVLKDNSDQTTENGIVFHDARWNTDGITADPALVTDLLHSNFLDFDAPDPALYPRGILLWNLRRSGFNVKRFAHTYVNTLEKNPRFGGGLGESMSAYYPHVWVSDAANNADGSGSFGRKAQRSVVLQALDSLINSNQQIRDEESRVFNLISCPGYIETLSSLVGLNNDRGLTSFIVSDSPARLTPDATTLSNWGQNVNNALLDNDLGLVTTDPYSSVHYPWGYTTDLLGNNIVVPPSHMMLRTIALSDNVSYPWFAPAGTRRGGITNASSVGYIDVNGEFQAIALNGGQRDTLASISVNPITYITGTGIVAYGQYTRQLTASSLDRINVARLVVYLRRQLSQLAKPYIFEPNDKITRDEIKQAAESMLLELVGQRAIYDYVVVCDTSNNTPARIDRSELWLDIAIEPVKAVEFIYIPLRLKNTGSIAALGGA